MKAGQSSTKSKIFGKKETYGLKKRGGGGGGQGRGNLPKPNKECGKFQPLAKAFQYHMSSEKQKIKTSTEGLAQDDNNLNGSRILIAHSTILTYWL